MEMQSNTPKNNALAISGFVTSLICCAPVGLGLSIAGLVQINKNPQQQLGKGFAIAGIIISSIALVVGLFYWAAILAFVGLGSGL